MKKLINVSKKMLLSLMLLTIAFNSNAELTKSQKEAIAWVDFAAGFASAELGPASFVIATVASTAYYKDKVATEGWGIINNPIVVLPSTSSNWGDLHNAMCSQYLSTNNNVDYNNSLNYAKLVKSDLTEQINAISLEYYTTKVNWVLSQNFNTVPSQISMISSIIPTNSGDLVILNQNLTTLHNATTNPLQFSAIDQLIISCNTFDLAPNDKYKLINSLEILRKSYILWSN